MANNSNNYYIGGRIIYDNSNISSTNKTIINIDPLNYEELIYSDDNLESMHKLANKLNNLNKESSKILSEERKTKLDKLYNIIGKYKESIDSTVEKYNELQNNINNITANDSLSVYTKQTIILQLLQNFYSSNENILRFLQIEFPLYNYNNKQMIYNEHIDIKPEIFHNYLIESDINLKEIEKIIFN